MKTRLSVCAALLLGLSAVALAPAAPAAAQPKQKTYALIAVSADRVRPADSVVADAFSDVAARMQARGFARVERTEDADSVMQVLFRHDRSYKVYVDALPLPGSSLERRRVDPFQEEVARRRAIAAARNWETKGYSGP
ncbi:MAG: hypothetical protein HY302_16600 [Opitutae bacterium]|nr:hypothetical protein [Opitutae bacterium]